MSANSVRAIVVDDEPIARSVLGEALKDLEGIEVVGKAENGRQALDQIASLKPDVVFLDLQMPEMDGFEVVRRLQDSPPCIVIVTAYDQHAIRAFEAGAVDYLLKPVREERLAQSLDRVRQIRGNRLAVAESVARIQELVPPEPSAKPRKIVGYLRGEYFLLEAAQVLAFQAERELVWIVTRQQRYLATQPLKAIQQKLAGLNFARVHRNCIANLDHVAKMAPLTSQRWLLTLNNQQELVVSKRQARAIKQLLSW